MILSQALSRVKSQQLEIEFALILLWLLFFPGQESPLFFLGFSFLLVFFIIRRLFRLKNLEWDWFTVGLLAFNAWLMVCTLFASSVFRSLLYVADILLVSLYFIFLRDRDRVVGALLRLLAWVITLSSLLGTAGYAAGWAGPQVSFFFKNPILQGIASALAALIFLHALLKRWGWPTAAALAVNGLAVVLAGSKAAFLGLFLIGGIMVFHSRKKWLAAGAIVLLLVVVLPNPLRRMAIRSLTSDPYALNRLDIWKMSLRMSVDRPLTGVGPNLFADHARRFNFPQETGGARYAKVPESPHSDYLKLAAETGWVGWVLAALFLFLIFKLTRSPPRADPLKWLLAFIALQMALFNFVFNNLFFLFVFAFMAQAVFAGRPTFKPCGPFLRLFVSSALLVVFLTLYLLPFYAAVFAQQAASAHHTAEAKRLLDRAALLSPLDDAIFYQRAQIHFADFRRRGVWPAWSAALADVRRIEKVRPTFIPAYILEANLFLAVFARGWTNGGLGDEILRPLTRAERWDPCNPFLKMQKARVLKEFGDDAAARREALEALKLEPEFVSALFFLQENFRYFGDPAVFAEMISRLEARHRAAGFAPGSYRYELYRRPQR